MTSVRDSRADGARAVLAQARHAAAGSDFAGAASGFRRVLAQAGEGPTVVAPDVRLRALLGLAAASYEVEGDLAATMALLDRAEDLAHVDELRHLRLAVIGQRALCQWRAGRPDEALAAFGRADHHLEQAPAEDRALLLLNRAALHLDRGDLGHAERDLARAAEIGDTAPDGNPDPTDATLLHGKVVHNQGYLAHLRGDLPTALALMEESERLRGGASAPSDPVALLDRARILTEAGLVEDADDLLADAVRLARAEGRDQEVGEASLARVRAALIGRRHLAAAGTFADQAVACFAQRGNPRWLRRARFTRLALAVELLQERASAAQPRGIDTAATLTANAASAWEVHDEIAKLRDDAERVGDQDVSTPARFMVAEVALLAGDQDRAAAALAGPPPRDDESLSVRLRWYRARAELALIGRDGDVQSIVGAGLGELSDAQRRVGSVDLRTAMAIHGLELAELGVTDALWSRRDEVIHRAVERAHASSTRLTPVRTRATDRERALLGDLRRIDDALWSAAPDRDPDGVAALRRRAGQLRTELRGYEWRRDGEGTRARTVALPRLRTTLARHGAVAVSFTAVGADLHAVRVDGSSLAVVPLGAIRDVGARVERLRADLQAVVMGGVPTTVAAVMRRSIASGLDALDDLLVGPLDVAGAPLVVVPHGAVALVPWPLLPGRVGRATTSSPCLTEWVRLAESTDRGGARSSGRLVALAGPGLRRADAEVAAIGDTWPDARCLVGPAATRAAMHDALASADVVHLAAHGTHRGSSPLFSSVHLADGSVFAHELGHDVAARLVVLSACEVGSPTIRHGDEPLGLTAALLQADVATVIAGLARVRDDVAHDVMLGVHQQLAAGASPAAALGVGVAEALDRGQVAPFTCAGAGLVAGA